jgi:hypothetical protein
MWWETLIQSGANVLIFGLAAYYIQVLINRSATNKINFYKSELDIKLAEHKEELERMTFKYSKFHERRLERLSDLYARISDLNIYMHDLTAIFKAVKDNYEKEELERMEKAKNAFNDFLFCFERNRIYINKNTCQLFIELRNEYLGNIIKYHSAHNKNGDALSHFKMIKEIQVSMQEKIPKIREELEEEIRGLISIDN